MSIGFKKITDLLQDEINTLQDLSEVQRDRLVELCKKIYMLESSTETLGRQRMISEIMGEIGHATDTLKRRAN